MRPILIATIIPGMAILNPPPPAHPGVAYSFTLTVIGGVAPYTFELRSTLPAGWSFNTTTGTISATSPLVTDLVTLTVYVRDVGFDNEILKTYTIQVVGAALGISGAAPDANVGDAASFAYSIFGGTAPYGATVSSGALPPGISMSLSGVLSGNYTTPGTYAYTVTVIDALGAVASINDSVIVSAVITFRIDESGNFRIDENGDSRISE